MVMAPDLCLIQGPPGTGKTTVIAEAIYQLVSEGKRVLLASQSNDAIDNALERLAQSPRIRAIQLVSEYRRRRVKDFPLPISARKTHSQNFIIPCKRPSQTNGLRSGKISTIILVPVKMISEMLNRFVRTLPSLQRSSSRRITAEEKPATLAIPLRTHLKRHRDRMKICITQNIN